MPRIIVTADPDPHQLAEETPVLLDEHVHSVHLSTRHAAAQLVERLAWAVADAEAESSRRLERGSSQERRVRQELQARRRRAAAPTRTRSSIAA